MAREIKFYDKNDTGFELFVKKKGNITLVIEDEDPYQQSLIEIGQDDIDDIIIALTDLKKEQKEFRSNED